MGPLVMAWLVGEGIICYRSVKVVKGPPGPGQLLLSSGIFVLLAIASESEKLRPVTVTLGWGFDIAAFMNIFSIGGPKGPVGPTAHGNTTQVNGGTWPPPIATNTVIFPNGTKSDNSTTGTSGSAGSGNAPPNTPGGILTPPGGLGGVSTPVTSPNPPVSA